jgi:hypothetical protein
LFKINGADSVGKTTIATLIVLIVYFVATVLLLASSAKSAYTSDAVRIYIGVIGASSCLLTGLSLIVRVYIAALTNGYTQQDSDMLSDCMQTSMRQFLGTHSMTSGHMVSAPSFVTSDGHHYRSSSSLGSQPAVTLPHYLWYARMSVLNDGARVGHLKLPNSNNIRIGAVQNYESVALTRASLTTLVQVGNVVSALSKV